MPVSFKACPFPQEIILTGVRWYLADPLSTRHGEKNSWRNVGELEHAP